jgi:hypothetical protein
MTKKYKIQHTENYWEMEVEIDHENADKHIKDLAEFWAGWEHDLRVCGGDYTKLFLRNLAYKVWREMVSHDWSLNGVLSLFEGVEGWYQMDGTYGIRIISADSDPTGIHDFTVETRLETI